MVVFLSAERSYFCQDHAVLILLRNRALTCYSLLCPGTFEKNLYTVALYVGLVFTRSGTAFGHHLDTGQFRDM